MKDSQEYIRKLFEDRALFEKEVLNALTNKDREEIVHILADLLVLDRLKEHLNFMYINDISDFTLNQIVNIMFEEIANEWIDYAIHDLKLSKNDALEALQLEERIKFIKLLSQDYYLHFKEYIFEKIADTFVELLVFNSEKNTKNVFINSVINSDLFPERRILNFNSSDQLCKAAKRAKDLKNEKLHNFKARINQIQNARSKLNIPQVQKDEFNRAYKTYEKNIEEVQKLKLESFDETLLNVKKALMNTLMKKE